MDNRVGANRPFKHQYYKMLSTKNGKPEGMWFRKNDYVLYDFQQRHNLTRLYGVGNKVVQRESPDFQYSNPGGWHWDDHGYNWSGAPIHLDGVGNRALHQTLATPRAYIETAIDGGQGDLPQTFAVSAYAKGPMETLCINGLQQARPTISIMVNVIYLVCGMVNNIT